MDLAKKIIKTTGSISEIKTNSQPAHYNVKDDPKRRCPNIEKAKKMLAYEPTIKIDEGLKRILEHV
jgi:nucleoside-diphosphate-sugar epimerase